MENFEKFRREVLNDRDMQNELMDIDRMDHFIVKAVALAGSRGLRISADEIREAARLARKSWSERWI